MHSQAVGAFDSFRLSLSIATVIKVPCKANAVLGTGEACEAQKR